MGMAAGGTFQEGTSSSEQPLAATVFVSCFGAFVLAHAAATAYPGYLLPHALLGLPFLVGFYGLLAVGIWNGSRVAWVFNVYTLAALLWRVVPTLTGPAPPDAVTDFNEDLLRAVMAVVLLTILFSPSLFRWIWHEEIAKVGKRTR